MPKISESRREERRRTILEAALRCFVRTGYQQTSMADIITESGLSTGAIYSYFPSKRELIRGVAVLVIGDRQTELAVAASEHPVGPAEIAKLLIDGVRKHAPVQALVQVWSEATVDAELRGLIQETIGGMRDTIATTLEPWAEQHPERLPEGADPAAWARDVTPVVLALIPGFALQRTMFDDFDEERYLVGVTELLRR
ncbi:TetR/AcrR family transcriptional regulator [Microbacterium sp. KUDC0406]|uniref:TetR/AcrR family transcriptional regulator n=1 Tax=Microbacterium sp. KUDC0406 TaxID=2909588 RepID=UPI001F4114E4|nr:TetR/AcrR family transcriptional regulator [Microbacterium sp. KUDC0406]UJP10094.1 TetR/AcrR family transcriptional regulator [Microbacterium sp. KUDC0406]